jgi:hypothetical protein
MDFLFFDLNTLKKKSGSFRVETPVETLVIEEVKKFNPDISQKLFPFTSLGGQDLSECYRRICELTGSQFCIFHQELEEMRRVERAYHGLDRLVVDIMRNLFL